MLTPSSVECNRYKLLSYKPLVQRIFQIVQYHLWCRLVKVFAIRYIDEPNFIFLTIDTYMIPYRPSNIYTQSSHLPSVCPSKANL